MKNTAKRLLSLLLVFCVLTSCIVFIPAVSVSAATTGSSTSSDVTTVLLNNSFENDTVGYNGGEAANGAADAYTRVTSNGNSYLSFTGSSNDPLFNYPVGSYAPSSGTMVIQFDFMYSAENSTSTAIAYLRTSAGEQNLLRVGNYNFSTSFISSKKFGMLALSDSERTGSGISYTPNGIQIAASSWYTVAFELVFTSASSYTVYAYYGNQGSTSLTSFGTAVNVTSALSSLRIDFGGDSYAWNMDNLLIYTTEKTTAGQSHGLTIDASDKGMLYNEYAAPIIDSSIYNGGFYFKVGVKSGLDANNNKVALSAAPFEYGGEIYIPVAALTEISGAAPAGGIETIGGVECVNIENMSSAYSGYYASYSSMGLIGISTTQNLFVEGAELSLIPIMQKFVFDNVTSGLENGNAFSASSMATLDHPYLFANQSKFDELKNAYELPTTDIGYDATLNSYVDYLVQRADSIYSSYATLKDGVYNGVNTTNVVMPTDYHSRNGYDVGGRLGNAASHNENIQMLAFAYQMTRDEKYAQLAYDYAIQMGTWEHWGPGHFLNAADAMAPYAIAYDWLYDAWTSLGLDVTAVESILFTHGLLPAYYASNNGGIPTGWVSTVIGVSGANYVARNNNWNAVCNGGVTVASLALMSVTTTVTADNTKIDTTVDGVYDASVAFNATGILTTWSGSTANPSPIASGTYQDYAANLINIALYDVPMNGLEQYVPDGSYIESNGYWSYGTNNLYEMAAALMSATGSDWGLLDAWGMDSTAYFALNTQSGGGQSWNYHDSNSTGPADTYWFQFLGSEAVYGQTDLAGIRKDFLENLSTIKASMWDVIYYMTDDEIGSWSYPELQYYAEGVDGYVVRDGWDLDSSYAAFMGNTNNLGHGQIDSGAFIYYNKGVKWFGDLGTENYNVEGFWGGSTRYTYYVMSGEGNNDLILTSRQSTLPYGQNLNGFGKITATGNNSYGAYAIIDNTSAYGSYASSALRGMLMTNDRRTVVIQDQVTFRSAESAAWIAHTKQRVILSLDGTVAYLVNGDTAIKVTLIDNTGSGLKFKIKDYSEHLLDATADHSFVGANGVAQNDLSGWKKLVIEYENVTTIDTAVVIEEVPFGESAEAFGTAYEWVDMNSWAPSADGRYESDSSGDTGETPVDPSTPEAPAVIATVTIGTYANAPEDAEDDTPIVDVFGSSTSSNIDTSDWGELTEVSREVATFEELAALVNEQPSTAVITIDLNWSNSTPITINNRCTVNLNGYTLAALSNNFIASVNGDVMTFDTGSVTVTWHINGESYTQTYTASCVASYNLDTALQERDNGDGTYSYFTYAWATSEGGKAASNNELIVTSSNCDFYAVEKPYDGYYVTVSGETITGYSGHSAIKEFFTSVVRGSYDRISITNSFEHNDTDGIAASTPISKVLNLYLNGNTITYVTEDTSDHMFGVSGTMNIYGPGGITNNAPLSDMFMPSGSGVLTVDGATLISANRAITDQRGGDAFFKNCDITINSNGTSAFGVINRNNVMSGDDMPSLVVSNCRIDIPNASGETAVLSIRSNAMIEVGDGTVITVGSGCYMFRLQNSTVGLNNESELTAYEYNYQNYDYSAYEDMWARLGEVYHNCELGLVTTSTDLKSNTTNAWYTTASEYTGTVTNDDGTVLEGIDAYEYNMLQDLATHIIYTVGAKFTEEERNSTTLNIENHIESGYVIAKQNSTTFPYVVALSTETGSVQWNSGTAEVWLAGELPEAPATTDKYFYTGITTVVAGESYDFKLSSAPADFIVSMNMSLQSDFNVNFYVPTTATGIASFIVNGEEVAVADAIIYNDSYYKLSITNIAPALSSGKFTLVIVFENGETLTIAYSIAQYAKKVITTTTSEESKKLMVNLLKYMEYAHVYAGTNNSVAYEEIGAVLDTYYSYAGAAVVEREKADTSAVSDAIESAQLYLDSALNFRFNLKAGYTGTVTFKSGDSVVLELNVVDGKHGENGELDYVDISRKAYDMLDGITIVTAGGEVTYTLANYYTGAVTAQGDLTSLLNSLYAYCECAREYQTYQKTL